MLFRSSEKDVRDLHIAPHLDLDITGLHIDLGVTRLGERQRGPLQGRQRRRRQGHEDQERQERRRKHQAGADQLAFVMDLRRAQLLGGLGLKCGDQFRLVLVRDLALAGKILGGGGNLAPQIGPLGFNVERGFLQPRWPDRKSVV